MSDINVTPLVDVMMVLLVIFIITAPLMVSGLKLDLPKAEGAALGAAPRVVKLALDAQGRVFLDDQAVSQDALTQALTARVAQVTRSGQGALPEVQLHADARVPYGRVVEVMGVAQKLGLNRIGFVTDRLAGAAKP